MWGLAKLVFSRERISAKQSTASLLPTGVPLWLCPLARVHSVLIHPPKEAVKRAEDRLPRPEGGRDCVGLGGRTLNPPWQGLLASKQRQLELGQHFTQTYNHCYLLNWRLSAASLWALDAGRKTTHRPPREAPNHRPPGHLFWGPVIRCEGAS